MKRKYCHLKSISLTTSGVANEENFVKMTYPFQWHSQSGPGCQSTMPDFHAENRTSDACVWNHGPRSWRPAIDGCDAARRHRYHGNHATSCRRPGSELRWRRRASSQVLETSTCTARSYRTPLGLPLRSSGLQARASVSSLRTMQSRQGQTRPTDIAQAPNRIL